MKRKLDVRSWTHRFVCVCGAIIEVAVGDVSPLRMPLRGPNTLESVRCPGCGVMDALPAFPNEALDPVVLNVRILSDRLMFLAT